MNRLQGVLRGELLPISPRECWEVECQLNPRTIPFDEWLEKLEKPRPVIAPAKPLPPAINPTRAIVKALRASSDHRMLWPHDSGEYRDYLASNSASEATNQSSQANGGSPQ